MMSVRSVACDTVRTRLQPPTLRQLARQIALTYEKLSNSSTTGPPCIDTNSVAQVSGGIHPLSSFALRLCILRGSLAKDYIVEKPLIKFKVVVCLFVGYGSL